MLWVVSRVLQCDLKPFAYWPKSKVSPLGLHDAKNAFWLNYSINHLSSLFTHRLLKILCVWDLPGVQSNCQ